MHRFPPDKNEDIWNIQKPLNFPELVYGLPRREDGASMMPDICKVMGERLSSHQSDEWLNEK